MILGTAFEPEFQRAACNVTELRGLLSRALELLSYSSDPKRCECISHAIIAIMQQEPRLDDIVMSHVPAGYTYPTFPDTAPVIFTGKDARGHATDRTRRDDIKLLHYTHTGSAVHPEIVAAAIGTHLVEHDPRIFSEHHIEQLAAAKSDQWCGDNAFLVDKVAMLHVHAGRLYEAIERNKLASSFFSGHSLGIQTLRNVKTGTFGRLGTRTYTERGKPEYVDPHSGRVFKFHPDTPIRDDEHSALTIRRSRSGSDIEELSKIIAHERIMSRSRELYDRDHRIAHEQKLKEEEEALNDVRKRIAQANNRAGVIAGHIIAALHSKNADFMEEVALIANDYQMMQRVLAREDVILAFANSAAPINNVSRFVADTHVQGWKGLAETATYAISTWAPRYKVGKDQKTREKLDVVERIAKELMEKYKKNEEPNPYAHGHPNNPKSW